jgi:PAS domain S-box-containing protein
MQERYERAEESARQSEAKYSTLVEHSNDGITIIQNEQVVFVNRKMLELTDYSMEEIIGRPVTDFVTPKYRQTISEYHRKRAAGVTVPERYEAEINGKNGQIVEVEINACAIDYQGKPASMAVVHDFTERNRHWAALLERETQLRFIYENVSDIIFVVNVESDGEYSFRSVNREYVKSTGIREDQIVGKRAREMVEEPVYSMILKKHQEAIQTRQPVRWEDTLIYPTGKKYEEITIAPVFNKDGICTQFIGTIHDISVHKQAETILSNYKDQLEKLVAERTAELAQKNLELERNNLRLQEVDRLKSVFLASMSHELRTPLNSIIGFTGIILQGLAGPINQEQKKQLGMVKSNAAHLLALINDILDMSKIEAGKLDVSMDEFSFNEVVSEAIENFSHAVNEKGLILKSEMPGTIRIYSDRRRIKQVLLNLINNAIKFTDTGSILVQARENSENLECSVIDTGKGIADEHINRLFQPFQQVDYSLIKKYQGSGLGLYLCKRMLDILGGSIGVASQLDKGSIFTFKVPLKCNEVLRK